MSKSWPNPDPEPLGTLNEAELPPLEENDPLPDEDDPPQFATQPLGPTSGTPWPTAADCIPASAASTAAAPIVIDLGIRALGSRQV